MIAPFFATLCASRCWPVILIAIFGYKLGEAMAGDVNAAFYSDGIYAS